MEFPKKDWTLFKEKIVIWQENRMATLCNEYIELLSSSAPSSEQFWALDERIKHDKHSAGVWVRMSRSEMPFIILCACCTKEQLPWTIWPSSAMK